MNDIIYPNGIDIDTGDYAIAPISVEQLDALVRREQLPENIGELVARARQPKSLGAKEGVDVKCLGQAGWGVIFADDADPAVEHALQPLLALRAAQADTYFRSYSGQQGFKVGNDDKGQFLARYKAGPGPADPARVPYYLLIVGSPDKIPYRFQSQLDVQYAVGRIHFDRLADYVTYAESVVAAETGRVKLPRQATFFGVTHPNTDPATEQSLAYLINPLSKALNTADGWTLEPVHGAAASKAALRSRLGGSQTPALLFTAGHGLNVSASNRRKLAPTDYQGALICADWPGPGTPFEHKDYYFAGSDLSEDANLLGLIACFFACYGAGTPQEDVYSRLQRMQIGQAPGPAIQLAAKPFIAGLPRRMLSAPGGGALAVIGHVERTWPSSYLWLRQADGTLPPQTATFESMLKRLMDGYPVGAAVEYLNQRYAELATELKTLLEDAEYPGFKDGVKLANTWMAANDAQWYTIVGDPAVRLPVVDAPAATPRPALVAVATRPGIAAPEPQPRPETAPTSASATAGATATLAPTPQGTLIASIGPSDPRFAQAYSPPPLATQELAALKAQHPELYASYVAHIQAGYANNSRIFDDVRRAFMRSHYSTLVMYWILFGIGVGTVITGIVLALQGSTVTGAIFLGVGAAAFITYFIGRSTLSVEENLIYITWLGVIYNSYWTHLAWATQPDSAQDELDKATVAAIAQLGRLLDRHARSVKVRPRLDAAASQPVTPAPPAAPDSADAPPA